MHLCQLKGLTLNGSLQEIIVQRASVLSWAQHKHAIYSLYSCQTAERLSFASYSESSGSKTSWHRGNNMLGTRRTRVVLNVNTGSLNLLRHMKLKSEDRRTNAPHLRQPSLLSIKHCRSSCKWTLWLGSLFLCLPLPYDRWRGETPGFFFFSSSKCSTIVICFCHLASLWNTHTRQWSIHRGPRECIFMCETSTCSPDRREVPVLLLPTLNTSAWLISFLQPVFCPFRAPLFSETTFTSRSGT